MPEGPEIRRAADEVEKVLRGNPIIDAWFAFPHLKRFEKRLRDTRVDAVDTRGKAMLTRFDNGLTMFSHNQLYGLWVTAKRDQEPDTKRELRVALSTDTHSALLYSASDIEVLTARQLERHPFLARVGPDALDPSLTTQWLAERLNEPGFRGRALSSLYLDQRFLAGIGNYLRSEILFVAGIDPRRKAGDLTPGERRRIARESIRLSRRSYRTGGVLVSPSIAREEKAAGRSFAEYRFWVFGREGLPCRLCAKLVTKTTAGSRGLFLCTRCQRG